jgi:O-antigen ligase
MNLSINKLNLAKAFFFLFLFSLFFPIRYVIPTKSAYLIGVYSDFTSVSLYLSDIFLIITWFFCFLPRGISEFWSIVKGQLSIVIFLIWLILDLIWHLQDKSSLNLWYSLKYAEFIVTYGTFSYLFSKTSIKSTFLNFFAFFATFESLLALWQFKTQKSLGLYKFGEEHLSRAITGVAKIVSSGTTYIRGYGTFPHSNVLSAFLTTGLLICLYLLINAKNWRLKGLYGLAIAITTFGLTVSFSRAGYLSYGLGLIIFFGGILYTQPVKKLSALPKTAWVAAGVCLASILLALMVFRPFLLTRANVTDDSSLQRIFYAKISLKIMIQHPIFGLGIGESILHMQQYSSIKLWYWQIQPIHNYFLLAGAELGIPGMLILIWIFLSHLISLLKQKLTTYYLLLTTILISILILMQFDHYFYTLQQTQLLLWMVLAIISSEIKNPSAEGLAKS